MTTTQTEDLELVYVGDPLCSWCWGFAPVLESIEERYSLPIRVVAGGLRVGDAAKPPDNRLRAFLREHWTQVRETTGQDFHYDILDREQFTSNSEPPCRSVVTMRELAPEHTLAWFRRVQAAFFVDGLDISDRDIYPGLLEEYSVDIGKFMEHFDSEEMRAQTQRDFADARALGPSFPSILLRDGDDHRTVTRGYTRWDQLEPALTGWLRDRYGEVGESLVCEVEDPAC